MHGDEATATMAMVDIFNFLENKTNNSKQKTDDELENLRTELLKNALFISFHVKS